MTLPYSRIQSVDLAPGVCLDGERMVLIAGPCVIELRKTGFVGCRRVKKNYRKA